MKMDGIKTIYGNKYKTKLLVLWSLTRRCNYDCSYCGSEHHDNYSKPIPLETLKKAVDKIISAAGGKNKVHFTFVGGEPTVHPQFKVLLLYINDNKTGEQVGIQTKHLTKCI